MAELLELDDFSDAALERNLKQPPEPIQSVLAPLTAQAAGDTQSQRNAPPQMRGQLSGSAAFIAQNQIEGVPLDVETGAPGFVYFKGALNRAKENELNYYKKIYGDENVRQANNGDIIFRALDTETGKPKDIVANPDGIDLRNFLDLAAQAPEIAGGIIAARTGKTTPGIWNALKKIGQMAIGTETAGAGKDIAVRTAQSQPVDLPEIGKSRSKLLVLDTAFGAGIGAGGKFLSKVISPFAERGALQFDLQEAQKYFLDKYRLPIPATGGEQSGSAFLLRSEAFMKKTPGAFKPFDEIVQEKNAALSKLQNIAVGLPPEATAAERALLPTEEVVGQKAISAIGGKAFPAEAEVQTARKAAATTGTAEIQSNLARATGLNAPVERGALGQTLRDTAESRRTAFKAQSEAEYGAVYNNPLTQQKNLPADNLAADAESILKKLPAMEVTTQVPTGVLGPGGAPILRTVQGEEVLKEFVPSNVVGKLKQLASLKGKQFRLDELIKMRTEVSDDILRGEAVSGVQTKFLNEIRGSLTKAIDEGLDKLGDPTLKKAWQTANDNYAKNVVQFKKAGIMEIFRDPQSGNFLGNEALVNRALSSGDVFKAYKDFYGSGSSEFAGLKRAVADNIYETNPITGMVDPQKFLNNLQAIYKNSPGTAKEVFGITRKPLEEIGISLSAIEGKVSIADLQKLANSKTLTYQKVLELASAEAKRDDLYRNSIIKDIATGNLNAEKIAPVEFVDRFVNRASPEEVRHVMALLHDRPDVLEGIRSQAVQKILAEASPSASAINNPAILKGSPMELKASKIQNALGDKTQREKYKSILGAGTYRDLEEMTKVLAPSELKEASFGAAGGLSAGMQIAGLLQKGELSYVFQSFKNYIGATMLTTPIIRKWVSNTLISPADSAAFVRTVIASTPFLEAVLRDFGDQAPAVMQNIKSGLDRGAPQSDPQDNRIPADQF